MREIIDVQKVTKEKLQEIMFFKRTFRDERQLHAIAIGIEKSISKVDMDNLMGHNIEKDEDEVTPMMGAMIDINIAGFHYFTMPLYMLPICWLEPSLRYEGRYSLGGTLKISAGSYLYLQITINARQKFTREFNISPILYFIEA